MKLALVLLLVLVSGCVSQELDCKEPFVKIGEMCCMDRNENRICDFYEQTTTTVPGTTTTTRTTTSTTTTTPEGLAVSGFQHLCEDNGDIWCQPSGDDAFVIDLMEMKGLNQFAEFYAVVTAGKSLTNLEVTHVCRQTQPSVYTGIYHQDGESWKGIQMDTWFDCQKCVSKPCVCDVYPDADKVNVFPAGEDFKYYIELDPRNAVIGSEFEVECVFTFESDQETVERTLVFDFV